MKTGLLLSVIALTACASQVPPVAESVDGQRQDWLAVRTATPVTAGCEVIKAAAPTAPPGARERAYKRSFYK